MMVRVILLLLKKHLKFNIKYEFFFNLNNTEIIFGLEQNFFFFY